MTELADRIRAINLNKHIEFMLLGDSIKLVLLPLWTNRTDLPGVHQAEVVFSGDKVRCNVWNISDDTCRMFPLDGTINTGFDYCIVIYDAITRIKPEQLDKWTTIRDQICSRQHPDRLCKLIVLVIKAPRTDIVKYQHIIDSCDKLNIHIILVDNVKEELNKIKSLLEKLANLVYRERKTIHHSHIRDVLKTL